MNKVMKSGIGALLVGGLMVSGFGVFNVGEVKTAEAASVTKKKAGSVTYHRGLGSTDAVKGKAFRPVTMAAIGVVNKAGTKADLQLNLKSTYSGSQKHIMKVYQLHDHVWFLADTRTVYSASGITVKPEASGTYYVSVESQYTAKGAKHPSHYFSKSKTFTHSTSVK